MTVFLDLLFSCPFLYFILQLFLFVQMKKKENMQGRLRKKYIHERLLLLSVIVVVVVVVVIVVVMLVVVVSGRNKTQ